MGQFLQVSTLVVLGASCVAAFTDIWRFKVYNVLTLPLLFSGLLFHTLSQGAEGLQGSMVGILLGFGILIFPYMVGALGAGDVKFVAAIGAWLGVQPIIPILVIGCLATGVYSIALVVIHGNYREVWANLRLVFFRLTMMGRHFGCDDDLESVQETARQDERRKRLIPFSAMIAIGVVLTLISSFWFDT